MSVTMFLLNFTRVQIAMYVFRP